MAVFKEQQEQKDEMPKDGIEGHGEIVAAPEALPEHPGAGR